MVYFPRANYMALDTGQHQDMVSRMVQKVDVKKSTWGSNVINQHTGVDPDIDEETAVAKLLFESSYSNKEGFVKNTTENVMRDTGQYYDTHDMILVKDVRGKVIMMSISLDTTASKVYGVHTTVIYIWDKEAKVVYNRKNSWDQCKFEDPDHRMVTTIWNLKIYQTEVFVREAFKMK